MESVARRDRERQFNKALPVAGNLGRGLETHVFDLRPMQFRRNISELQFSGVATRSLFSEEALHEAVDVMWNESKHP